jgi:hypothetical protein
MSQKYIHRIIRSRAAKPVRIFPQKEICALLLNAVKKIKSSEDTLKEHGVEYEKLVILLADDITLNSILEYCKFYVGDKITDCVKIIESKVKVRIIVKDKWNRIFCPVEICESEDRIMIYRVRRPEPNKF